MTRFLRIEDRRGIPAGYVIEGKLGAPMFIPADRAKRAYEFAEGVAPSIMAAPAIDVELAIYQITGKAGATLPTHKATRGRVVAMLAGLAGVLIGGKAEIMD